jgi:hypothetical protein
VPSVTTRGRRAVRAPAGIGVLPSLGGGTLTVGDLAGPASLVLLVLAWFRSLSHGAIAFDDILAVEHWSDRSLTWAQLTVGDTTANRWRPVFATVMVGVARVFGEDYTGYFWFNVALFALLVLLVYAVARELSGSRVLATAAGALVVTSRFTYYGITQVLGGPLETLAQIWLVLLAYAWWCFVRTGRARHLGVAAVLDVLLVHTHERYVVLVLLLVPLVLTRRRLSWRARALWSAAFVVPLLVSIAVRVLVLHLPLLVGTGSVTELGFAPTTTTEHVWQAVVQTMGVNVGPGYLHGLTFPLLSSAWKAACLLVVGLMAAPMVAAPLMARRVGGGEAGRLVGFLAVAAAAIGLQIASFSVTIRLEPRWILGPFVVWVLAWSHCAGWIARRGRAPSAASVAAAGLVVVLSIGLDAQYRANAQAEYFMGARAGAADMLAQTVGRYGSLIATHRVYVVDESGGDAGAYVAALIRANTDVDGLTITSVTDLTQVPRAADVLVYDLTGGFHEVVGPRPGYALTGEAYGDGWVGKSSGVRGTCGTLTLTIHPYRPDPAAHVRVTLAAGPAQTLTLAGPETVVELDGATWGGSVELTFDRVVVPAEDGSGTDHRPLAAQVGVVCTEPAAADAQG